MRDVDGSPLGQNPPRGDGRGKVDGSLRYVDDLAIPGVWHGATVRIPTPRARIRSIDVSALVGEKDVVIVTAADLPGPNALHLIADDWPVLAEEETSHAFEPVALVAAPTRARAKAAAALIHVDIDELPAITSLEEAMSLGGEATVFGEAAIHHGDTELALRSSDFVIEGTYDTGHQEHLYLETQGAIAIPHRDGSLEIIGSLQCPFYVRKALAPLFGLPEEAVRIRQAPTGGGFGGKEDFPDMVAAHAALLARKARHPVKVIYDRHEDLVATTKRHPARIHHRTGVRRDGTLIAMEIDVVMDGGAYTTLSPVVLSRGILHAAGPYRCPNVRVHGRVLKTNTAPNGAFRGFGAPQTQFAMERQLDRIARSLNMDPLTVRERNAYRPGDVTPTGQVLGADTSALECLAKAEARTRFREVWAAQERARSEAADDGKPRRGLGLSLTWHGTGFTGNGERKMHSPVLLRLLPGGDLEILVAATDFGQGTTTVLAQIVAAASGQTLEHVLVAPPDTGTVPDSGPTVASRTVNVVGGALADAARILVHKVLEFFSALRTEPLASLRVRHGRILHEDRDLGAFAEWADAYLAVHGSLEVEKRHELPADQHFDEATYQGTAYSAYTYGVQVVEVEVDPDTLATTPLRATFVADVGRAIHPVLCSGQIEGGALQAIAFGYMEEIKLRDGRYWNDRLATCLVPTASDVPLMETILLEHPATVGPFGAKGVGEWPMDGGAPAVAQAIENAVGIEVTSAPATPEKLLKHLAQGRVFTPAVTPFGVEQAPT